MANGYTSDPTYQSQSLAMHSTHSLMVDDISHNQSYSMFTGSPILDTLPVYWGQENPGTQLPADSSRYGFSGPWDFHPHEHEQLDTDTFPIHLAQQFHREVLF